jgi:hypothetical protein
MRFELKGYGSGLTQEGNRSKKATQYKTLRGSLSADGMELDGRLVFRGLPRKPAKPLRTST